MMSIIFYLSILLFIYSNNLVFGIGNDNNISFVSIGDWGGAALGGYHLTDEVTVAKSFASAAENLNAQFILNTGDNFYYYGIKSVTDPMWENTYEQIYTQKSMMVKW